MGTFSVGESLLEKYVDLTIPGRMVKMMKSSLNLAYNGVNTLAKVLPEKTDPKKDLLLLSRQIPGGLMTMTRGE